MQFFFFFFFAEAPIALWQEQEQERVWVFYLIPPLHSMPRRVEEGGIILSCHGQLRHLENVVKRRCTNAQIKVLIIKGPLIL